MVDPTVGMTVLSSSCNYIHGAEKLWEGYAYKRQGRRPKRWDDLATARRLKQKVQGEEVERERG